MPNTAPVGDKKSMVRFLRTTNRKGNRVKVKITATITYETELTWEDYTKQVNPPKTDDEILAFERDQWKADGSDSEIAVLLFCNGELSDFKIEKVEDTAAPAAEEAA